MPELIEIYTTLGWGGLLAFIVYKFIYLRMKEDIVKLDEEKKELIIIIKDMVEKQHESLRWIKDTK